MLLFRFADLRVALGKFQPDRMRDVRIKHHALSIFRFGFVEYNGGEEDQKKGKDRRLNTRICIPVMCVCVGVAPSHFFFSPRHPNGMSTCGALV